MRLSKRNIFFLLIFFVMSFFIATYELPYYVFKPGEADALNEIVAVDGGRESEGDMHLVTVSGGKATPIQYVAAKFFAYHDIVPAEEARPEGISDDEYLEHQLHLMENSQEASTVVAYKSANKKIEINYLGVYVISIVEGMPAEDVVQVGDRITKVDGHTIEDANDLIDYVNRKRAGDTIKVHINRDDDELVKTLALVPFPENEDKIGIGIQLVTDRDVKVEPEVHFKSGKIGGPSAGLMFALEIYDQLTESDLTKGYDIAGTGEIDYDGNVLRIGGVDKKVVAAHKQGCDVFFAPNERGQEDSNYEIAKQVAQDIDTDMEIVPVDTFEDALAFLENLEEK